MTNVKQKMNDDLFYDLRHLKIFKDLSKNNNTVWRIRWEDGKQIEIYNTATNMTFNVPDIHLAEYICTLHNMSKQMIKEVESKYVV